MLGVSESGRSETKDRDDPGTYDGITLVVTPERFGSTGTETLKGH